MRHREQVSDPIAVTDEPHRNAAGKKLFFLFFRKALSFSYPLGTNKGRFPVESEFFK